MNDVDKITQINPPPTALLARSRSVGYHPDIQRREIYRRMFGQPPFADVSRF